MATNSFSAGISDALKPAKIHKILSQAVTDTLTLISSVEHLKKINKCLLPQS